MSLHIGVRLIHNTRHGLSVHREGDQLVWRCRCGEFEHSHQVDTPVTPSTLTDHFKWVIW